MPEFLQYNGDQKKNICFVLGDDEILFNKNVLAEFSPYIKTLTMNLDSTKNVRILLPKWIKKTAFIKYLKFITSQEYSEPSKPRDSKSPQTKNEIENASQDIIWNMLQISDFFQTKTVLDDCIKNLIVSRENCYLFIQESLKKIESSQRTNNGYARDSWFNLTQKCITVAAQTLTSQREMDQLKELSSKYLQKEILERYIKNQISNVNGIEKQELFNKAINLCQEAKNCESYDFLSFFDKEYKEKLNTINQKKKAYINWAVQLNPQVISYQSDIVRIDELSWKFQVQIDEGANTFNIYIKNLGQGSTNTIGPEIQSSSTKNYVNSFLKQRSQSPVSSASGKGMKQSLTSNTSQNSLNKSHAGGLQSSYLYSMNRIASKQRQPNQNCRQKNPNQPNTPSSNPVTSFIQKAADKQKRNASQGLASQRSEDQKNSFIRYSQNTSIIQNQSGVYCNTQESQSRNSSNMPSFPSKKCNSIHDEGFPIIASVEVMLQQKNNQNNGTNQQSKYTSFVNLAQKPYLIGRITPKELIDFTQPYFFKIIFKIDFTLSAFLYHASTKMEKLYDQSSVQMLNHDNFRTLLYSGSLNLENQDHFLQLILSWTSLNKSYFSEFMQLVNWNLISQDYLIYLYQNQYLLEGNVLQEVKNELLNRNLLNENFEALLQEKFKEITELKGELEKYKMSEKLATSILESPYNYNSAQQAIRKRKRDGSNLGTSSNVTQEILGDIMDSSYTSHNSQISFIGNQTAMSAIGTAEKPSFNVSEGKFSEKALDSNPSTPHQPEKSSRTDLDKNSQRQKQVAINLENLVKQISQISETSQLDKLLDESQKIILDNKISHNTSISDKRSSSAASQLKDILYQNPPNKNSSSGLVTAATTKNHTRSTSQNATQLRSTIFHSKNPSNYQQINQPRIIGGENLDNLNLADINYQHPTSQKHINLMAKPAGNFQFGMLNNTTMLTNQQKMRGIQMVSPQQQQAPQILQGQTGKKQPRFIIKKPKAQ